MALEKDYLRGPSAKDHAKDAMLQGGVGLAIGVVATLGTWWFLGVAWFLFIGIGIVGLFRLLQGLISYLTGWE